MRRNVGKYLEEVRKDWGNNSAETKVGEEDDGKWEDDGYGHRTLGVDNFLPHGGNHIKPENSKI